MGWVLNACLNDIANILDRAPLTDSYVLAIASARGVYRRTGFKCVFSMIAPTFLVQQFCQILDC